MHMHFGGLFAAEDGDDVTFRVAGETFRAILAARSPVFKAELLGAMRESNAAAGECIQIGGMFVSPGVQGLAALHIHRDSLPEETEGRRP